MTRRVIAFVADSPEARPVIAVASLLGQIFSAQVEAIHVGEELPDDLTGLAEERGIDLRLLSGDPMQRIVDEMGPAGVVAGVVGTRGPHGPRPAGHIALQVISRVSRMMAVVPPQAHIPEAKELRRILVPLDGTEESAQAVRSVCRAFDRPRVEILVLHIFDRATVPSFWDQAQYAAEAWGEEFRARFLESTAARVALRSGTPEDWVLTVGAEEHSDFIALGWSQRLDPGRARVIRRLLSEADLPVLLVPIRTDVSEPDSQATPPPLPDPADHPPVDQGHWSPSVP